MCEGGRPAEASMAASGRRPQPGLSGSLAEEDVAGGGEGGAQATRRKPRGWRAVAFIIGVYAAAYLGTNAFNFSLTTLLIGRYNMKPSTATNVNNVFSGTFSFSPVVGAFVADALWGRFRTLLFGTAVGVIGMTVITLSVTVHGLKPPPCSPLAQQAGTCAAPSGLQRGVLYAGMGLLVVSAGGMNPTSLPFAADQFDAKRDERQKGALERFYNWYYAIAMASTFVALTVVVYLQVKVSWGVGFAIPTALMAAAFAAFLAGSAFYVYVPPEGSIFSSVARVFVASCRKWRLPLPHPRDARRQEALLYNGGGPPAGVARLPLTQQLSFMNKAAIVVTGGADEIRADGSPARRWSLCSVQEVEEAKCLVKVIPVWVSGTLWFTAVAELTNYTYLQASTMDLHMGRHFTIPAVSILAVFYLAVALSVPVYDLLVARAARRLTRAKGGRGITLLQRQGAGLVVGAAAFVVAAAVERRRRASALAHGGASPLSVFHLAPQLAVMGASGALSMVGQTEFYNTQFPEQMRTLANAAFYCAQGVSSYLATLVVSIVNARTRRRGGGSGSDGWATGDDINAGRIDYFYYVMAVLTGANLVYFLVCAHFYQYKGEQAADSTPAGPGLEPAAAEDSSGSTSESDAALLKT
ncbi:unnamed protein product [Urochloa decumbens]|uniref:Uncharacterized protein n=1 Tax=Urochloa decumbens TaxID=240449 RepID=A0ABC9C4B3_9POAL